MTAHLMKEQVYSAIYLILLKKNRKQLDRLSELMNKFKDITLERLKISKYFQFDKKYRGTFQKKQQSDLLIKGDNELDSTKNTDSNIEQSNQIPFREAINHLAEIKQIEQPTQKLEHIYGLNKTIIKQIDQFWADYNVKSSHLAIDTDNLLGVYIFVILKSNFPQILVEIQIASQFLTDVAKLSNKAVILGFFLATLQTSLEFIMKHLEADLQQQQDQQYQIIKMKQEQISAKTMPQRYHLQKQLVQEKDQDFADLVEQSNRKSSFKEVANIKTGTEDIFQFSKALQKDYVYQCPINRRSTDKRTSSIEESTQIKRASQSSDKSDQSKHADDDKQRLQQFCEKHNIRPLGKQRQYVQSFG